MSDDGVHAALRSNATLVVVEAPAGCGKTTAGATYAREIAATGGGPNRLLILTHTHAACSVFADHTKGAGHHVEIHTIDSVITQIASAYHLGLGLPPDIASWIRQRGQGHAELALKVAELLKRFPMIAASLAQRYHVVICDEHQDSSAEQHSIVIAMHNQGAKLRVFGDPLQRIFKDRCDWDELTLQAQAFEQLDIPHRWTTGCPNLGQWTLLARTSLKTGRTVDLRSGLPPSVTVVFAENQSRRNLDYQLSRRDRKQIDAFERARTSLLLLTPYGKTARSFRALFNRRIPLWEGHIRPGLEKLVNAIASAQRDRTAVAAAIITFMGDVGKGFSRSAFGDRFEREVREGCKRMCRDKPRTIQELASLVVAEPNHIGVAKMLRRVSDLATADPNFRDIKIDCGREFWEAIQLGNFDCVESGLTEITHRRAYSRPKPPEKAISTIHKAKGLECDSVIVMPCDAETFPDKEDARCLLYVALSRAKRNLMLVVSRKNPSPLLSI